MSMVGHQNKGMNCTTCAFCIFFKPIDIKKIIFLCKKTGLSVVTPLNDVEGNVRYNYSGSSWHGMY